MLSKHSKTRCQQRCIPPIVQNWLDEFGVIREQRGGCLKVFFNRDSQKEMGKKYGRQFVRENKKYLNAYRVESPNGTVITAGWRTSKF
jgi:hypothetical protein